MIRIESSSNTLFKQTKKLLTRSGRKKTGSFIIEGERIVRDAANGRAKLQYIFVSDSFGEALCEDFGGVRIYSLPDKLFDELKSTVNSQGILAVADYIDSDLDEIDFTKGCYLYLDSVADPGNMGTIIRSADAFGADGIILSSGCVDVFNPKVLRSTMSGIFNIKLYFDDGTLPVFYEKGFRIIGTFPDGASSSADFEYSDKCVIVMGNEANGICPQIEKYCTHRVTIPMTGGAESLNVSVACGIMLYEAFIHRDFKRGDD
ncbi:MAG: RNA methyltransferase [Clostridia bacterium]|nr:RNA methyltransferase [Clostridia bacterium]